VRQEYAHPSLFQVFARFRVFEHPLESSPLVFVLRKTVLFLSGESCE
jgi:hypothetical protein